MGIERIINNRLLKGLSAEHLRTVEALGEYVRFRPHEIVIRDRAPNSHLYLIVGGGVNVVLPDPSGRTGVPLASLGIGDCVGEYSFVDSKPPDARVQAGDNCELLRIPHSRFRELIDTHNQIGRVIYRNLLTHLVMRLRAENEELDLFRM